MIHAVLPWNSPFVQESTAEYQKESDYRYSKHNTCCAPGCYEWVRNDAKTCQVHRSWYDTTVRYPARRLERLLKKVQARPELGGERLNRLFDERGRFVLSEELERILRR